MFTIHPILKKNWTRLTISSCFIFQAIFDIDTGSITHKVPFTRKDFGSEEDADAWCVKKGRPIDSIFRIGRTLTWAIMAWAVKYPSWYFVNNGVTFAAGANLELNIHSREIHFVTKKKIKAGDELVFVYNHDA